LRPLPIGQGSVDRYGDTVSAKLYPSAASQLIDQVMTPRIPGQVCGGTKLPQSAPEARHESASSTTDGETYPLPAADVDAGSPIPTCEGERPPSSSVQARAVMKFYVPSA